MTTTHELCQRLARLAADTGPLGRIAGLGVGDIAPAALEAALTALTRTFAVVDGRVGTSATLDAALDTALVSSSPLLLLVAAPLKASSRLAASVAAIADRRALPDGTAWPAGRSALVVVVGAETFEQLPEALRRVDFWEFCT